MRGTKPDRASTAVPHMFMFSADDTRSACSGYARYVMVLLLCEQDIVASCSRLTMLELPRHIPVSCVQARGRPRTLRLSGGHGRLEAVKRAVKVRKGQIVNQVAKLLHLPEYDSD